MGFQGLHALLQPVLKGSEGLVLKGPKGPVPWTDLFQVRQLPFGRAAPMLRATVVLPEPVPPATPMTMVAGPEKRRGVESGSRIGASYHRQPAALTTKRAHSYSEPRAVSR